MKIALVNTNRIRPPVGPIGLEYAAEALVAAGHDTEILDLTWAADAASLDGGMRRLQSTARGGLGDDRLCICAQAISGRYVIAQEDTNHCRGVAAQGEGAREGHASSRDKGAFRA